MIYSLVIKKSVFILLSTITCIGFFNSCLKDGLKETPRSFLTPENAFENESNFESAIGDLYRLGRGLRTSELMSGESDKTITTLYGSGTDLGYYWDGVLFYGDYNRVNSTDFLADGLWKINYDIIKGANLIISRLDDAPIQKSRKLEFEAEARWFRGYAYRFLVYLFGDVPIVHEVIEGPKFDFTRDQKVKVLNFMKNDFEFASENLPKINAGEGHLSKAAADHFLAETFLSLNLPDSAVRVASRVIDDNQYALMFNRFGSFIDKPGDVFSDLFRLGNQNRSSGNTESILVWQMGYNIDGGMAEYRFERAWAPRFERLLDANGEREILLVSDSIGRGQSFFCPTWYLSSILWKNSERDIRNSKFNMQRIFYNNNPNSEFFGQIINPMGHDTVRDIHVWVKKASMPYGHPQGEDNLGHIYTNIYALRLAETYLLRAEAYLDLGLKQDALNDINYVRSRAHAPLITDENSIDIDFILDERARELVGEEPRRLTLARVGLLYDRVKRYNPISAHSIKEYNNLLPIPQTTIDANSENLFNQNPGY